MRYEVTSILKIQGALLHPSPADPAPRPAGGEVRSTPCRNPKPYHRTLGYYALHMIIEVLFLQSPGPASRPLGKLLSHDYLQRTKRRLCFPHFGTNKRGCALELSAGQLSRLMPVVEGYT